MHSDILRDDVHDRRIMWGFLRCLEDSDHPSFFSCGSPVLPDAFSFFYLSMACPAVIAIPFGHLFDLFCDMRLSCPIISYSSDAHLSCHYLLLCGIDCLFFDCTFGSICTWSFLFSPFHLMDDDDGFISFQAFILGRGAKK